MKQCPYCGKAYPDEYSVCAVDQNPLEASNPKPPPSAPDSEVERIVPNTSGNEKGGDTKQPDGFQCLGRFEPFEADRLLEKFVKAGVRFQIDKLDKRVFTSGSVTHGAGYVNATAIEIFIHKDDAQKATGILTADWKV